MQLPWLIFADRYGLGERLASTLQDRDQPGLLVAPGEAYDETDTTHVSINPNQQEDFVRLVGEKSYRGIIYLWTLDNDLSEETTVTTLGEAQQLTTGSLLHLTQAMIHANKTGLWLVTRGAQTVEADKVPVSAGQTATLGLSRTIALEHPELHCKRIDLDPQSSQADVENLLDEILQRKDHEEEIAFRDSRRVRRLIRAKTTRTSPLEFKSDASYLVTGGLRGLGLLVAEWMTQRGAKHIALISRSSVSTQTQETIDRLEQYGTHVLAVQGDVSSEEDCSKVLAEIEQSLPPLRGIVHSAGVLDDGMLLQQNWARFEKVMAPKITGTWLLHSMTRHIPLDFFVMFSSGVSLLGSVGQANHAAANAFMDGFAAYRRALGLPATSLNWGAWSQVGAAADRNLADTRNVATFTPEEGLQALEWAIQQNVIQAGVLSADWNTILQPYPPGEEPVLFREIARQVRRRIITPEKKIKEASLIQRLTETVPNKRISLLLAHVRQQAGQVLKTDDINSIDLYKPLQSMGLDSLMAVELRNKLGESTGQSLPATLLFEYPTMSELADYLAGRLLASETENQPIEESAATQASRTDTPKETASLEELSEDELAEMLKAKLGKIGSD